jgi:hypothetical protein
MKIFKKDLNNGEEDTILLADTGKVFVRALANGRYLLGLDTNPDPEKWCRVIIPLTDLQRSRLIEILSERKSVK